MLEPPLKFGQLLLCGYEIEHLYTHTHPSEPANRTCLLTRVMMPYPHPPNQNCSSSKVACQNCLFMPVVRLARSLSSPLLLMRAGNPAGAGELRPTSATMVRLAKTSASVLRNHCYPVLAASLSRISTRGFSDNVLRRTSWEQPWHIPSEPQCYP